MRSRGTRKIWRPGLTLLQQRIPLVGKQVLVALVARQLNLALWLVAVMWAVTCIAGKLALGSSPSDRQNQPRYATPHSLLACPRLLYIFAGPLIYDVGNQGPTRGRTAG